MGSPSLLAWVELQWGDRVSHMRGKNSGLVATVRATVRYSIGTSHFPKSEWIVIHVAHYVPPPMPVRCVEIFCWENQSISSKGISLA
jgi:hypothetical protein